MFKTLLLTTLALFSFAGNSVLCRYALKDDIIDPSSFTAIRLASGAVFLLVLVSFKNRSTFDWRRGSWSSSFLLFLYAAAFSFSYVTLDTGTGALILFGSVQVTMVLMSLFKGKMLLPSEWIGLIVAFSGLAILLIPSATAPTVSGFIFMAVSGISWGFYTLAGRHSAQPLADTANIFLRSLAFIVVLVFFNLGSAKITEDGIVLAVISGAITSGLGYAIWYSALAGLSLSQAAIFQLTVPMIAAFGGVIFSNEAITTQLAIASLLILGGVLVVTLGQKYTRLPLKKTP